jgi:hypothetical protein
MDHRRVLQLRGVLRASSLLAAVAAWVAAAAPSAAQTALPGNELQKLEATLQQTPTVEVRRFLETAPLGGLSQDQQARLLGLERQPGWRRAVGTILNLYVPGVGSLSQGDWRYGIPLLGTAAAGFALLLAGDPFKPGSSFNFNALTISGLLIYAAAWGVGLVRPWQYQTPRYRILEEYFAKRVRLRSAVLEISPWVFALRRLGGGEGRAPADRSPLLYGVGAEARF